MSADMVVIGHCRNCRYWKEASRDRKVWDAQQGRYRMELWPFRIGECQSAGIQYDCPTRSLLRDGLTYWDNEDYGADHRVGEDFGCVHFSAKDAS